MKLMARRNTRAARAHGEEAALRTALRNGCLGFVSISVEHSAHFQILIKSILKPPEGIKT